MKRQYIAAVILLLSLGVISTYALSGLGQQTLTESVTTEYVIKYSGTAQIVDTTTTSTGADHIKLYIEVTQSEAEQVRFEILPCSDVNGQTEMNSDGTHDYQVKIVYTGGESDTTASQNNIPSGQRLGFNITSADTTSLINYVEVEWTGTDMYADYWSAAITAEDV